MTQLYAKGDFMPFIRPIKELRNTSEISDLCHQTKEPVFITKNGREDMVIMSNETYERSIVSTEVMIKLLIAQQQLADGIHVDCSATLQKFRERYRYNGK